MLLLRFLFFVCFFMLFVIIIVIYKGCHKDLKTQLWNSQQILNHALLVTDNFLTLIKYTQKYIATNLKNVWFTMDSNWQPTNSQTCVAEDQIHVA